MVFFVGGPSDVILSSSKSSLTDDFQVGLYQILISRWNTIIGPNLVLLWKIAQSFHHIAGLVGLSYHVSHKHVLKHTWNRKVRCFNKNSLTKFDTLNVKNFQFIILICFHTWYHLFAKIFPLILSTPHALQREIHSVLSPYITSLSLCRVATIKNKPTACK